MSIIERLAAMSEEERLIALEYMPSHLADQGESVGLYTLLTMYDFLKAKINAMGIERLIDDYELTKNSEVDPKDRALQRIADALRAGVVVLKQTPGELWNQVKGRVGIALSVSHPRPAPRFDLNFATLLGIDEGLVRVYPEHRNGLASCAFSPDGRLVLSCEDLFPELGADRSPRLWDVTSGNTVRVFEGHSDKVHRCAFSPDGRLALSASADHTLRLWNVADGAVVSEFKGHAGAVLDCAFSPDRRHALSASTDHTLRLWDVSSGRTVRVFQGHLGMVHACVFSPGGRYALSAAHDGTLRLWDVASAVTMRVFIGSIKHVFGCAMSPDGRLALSAAGESLTNLEGYKKQLGLWDIANSTMIRSFEGHTNNICGCAMSLDGRQALSASVDQTLRLWDVASGHELCRWTTDAGLGCCVFSPDGATVIAGDDNGFVHFLSIVDNDEELHLTPQAETVRNWSPSLFDDFPAKSAELSNGSPNTDSNEDAPMMLTEHIREAVKSMVPVILWMLLLATGLTAMYSSVVAPMVSDLYGGDAALVIHSYLASRVPIIIDIIFLLTVPVWVVQAYGYVRLALTPSERSGVRLIIGLFGGLPLLAILGIFFVARLWEHVAPASTLEERIFLANHLALSLVLIVSIACVIKILHWFLPGTIKRRVTVIAILLGGMWVLVAYLIPIWVWGVLFFATVFLIVCFLMVLLWLAKSKSLYPLQGKYEEDETLSIWLEHADTATNLNNIALHYKQQEKYVEAESLYKQALAIKEKQLGSNHPSTALGLNNLAVLYEKQGKYAEAEPLFMRALKIYEQQLGTEHLNTMNCQNNLADLYQKQEKYAQAELLYKQVLAIREQQLGAEHPDTQTARSNYVSLLEAIKQAEEYS